jgi:diguanylate cyclase (GGDEF)-like protein
MTKEWSSFRITLVLYILVLILPLSFYFVYSSFKTIQSDTKIVHQTASIGGEIEYLALNPTMHNTQQKMTNIESIFKNISSWVVKNDSSDLYIGTKSLSEDFTQVQTCWDTYKQVISKQNTMLLKDNTFECYEKITSFSIVIEKMVYLKQKKLINLFYASLIIAMLLILLIIYFVRIYIHKQLNKHAIHDHQSKLFNKKYFMAELKTICSRSERHHYPLSILRVSINDFEKGNNTYSEREKRNTLKVFGMLIHALIRDGDIPCRYDDNHFLILLPFTEEKYALILEERIEEVLNKDKWITSKKITFDFNTTEFNKKESEEAFILRTLA